MRIFYAWQSDTPNRIGRTFIREAGDRAISELEAEFDLDDAERIELDQDTQGILGSPEIAATIFRKIAESDVVLVDTTLTGETAGKKKLINSNVAIETGYTLGKLSDEKLLKVMNVFYGQPEELPFDLRHRRHPVTYSLAPNASTDERRAESAKLTSEIKQILALYIENLEPASQGFSPLQSTSDPARYWEPGEHLTAEDSEHGWPALKCDERRLMYLRIWPRDEMEPLSNADTAQLLWARQIGPLQARGTDGWSNSRNKF